MNVEKRINTLVENFFKRIVKEFNLKSGDISVNQLLLFERFEEELVIYVERNMCKE